MSFKTTFFQQFLFLCILFLCSCGKKHDFFTFRIALATEQSAMPFYILSALSSHVQWDVRIIPDENHRFELLQKGEVQGIEYDIVQLYRHSLSKNVQPLMGILPIQTPYALIGQPGLTPTQLAEKNAIVGIDYQGIRSFLLDYWLKGTAKMRESSLLDTLRTQRLQTESLQAVVVSEPALSELTKQQYALLASTQDMQISVGTLTVLQSTDENLIKNVLLDYQQMLNRFHTLGKKIPRILAKYQLNFTQDQIMSLAQGIYFSPQLFSEVDTWLHLIDPTLPYVNYEDLFWTPNEKFLS